MAIYRGSGGANEATDAATNQAAAAAEYARQASESALDTQALYSTFNDTYLGSKSTAPILDNDGNALAIGALYFDSVENKLKVYSDIGWIDSAVASPSSFTSQAFSGTGAQTVFTLSIAPSSIQSLLVFVAGIRLRPTLDYTVASTTLTFTVAPANATNNISVLVVTTLAVGTPDDNSISTVKIQNGVVTLDKLATDSVDSSKIVNGTIVVGDLNASVLVASNVSNTPAGNIVATNVQTALNELDTEKAKGGANSDITSLSGLTTPLSISQGGTGLTTPPILNSKIQPITASVGASALTVTLNPTSLDFRDATLTSGAVNSRTVSSAISLVVPSGATLGTTSAVQSRLIALAIDNAGTVELAIVNLAGGNDLSETGVISTTALSAGSDSANVIYSTTARTNVPYRVVGYVESTQATAGTWATAPSTIQGYGGQALAAMSSLGYGQTWQNVTGSRTTGTTYYNTTGRPIEVVFAFYTADSVAYGVTVNGVLIARVATTTTHNEQMLTVTIPVNASYIYSVVPTVAPKIYELR